MEKRLTDLCKKETVRLRSGVNHIEMESKIPQVITVSFTFYRF